MTATTAKAITTTYTYDILNRIVKSESIGTSYMQRFAYSYDNASNFLKLTVQTTTNTIIDSDQDGLNDDWEMYYFNTLNVASHLTDADGDHYLDLAEFTNWKGGATDSLGNLFDPLVENAPNGPGYQNDDSAFWLMMMPVILNSVTKKAQ